MNKYLKVKTIFSQKNYNTNITSEGVSSFVIDSSGQRVQYVDSKVGIIAVARAGLTDSEMRICALELLAALGKNPCITVNEQERQ